MEQPEPRYPVPWLPLAAIALLFAIILFGLWRARGAGQLTACQSNVISLTSVITVYQNEHQKRLPASLDSPELKPYLRAVPTCPAVGRRTYAYIVAGSEFTVYCKGDNHRHFLPGPETVDLPREAP